MFNATVSLALLTLVTLLRPSVSSRLKLTDRSFTHHAPVLWNSLHKKLRQPRARHSLIGLSDSTSFLLYPRISFIHNSRLNSSTNLFLLSLFALMLSVLWFSDLAYVISSHTHFHCYHPCSHRFYIASV